MASFTITHLQRVQGYAVVQTLEDTDIAVGQSITISGASDNTFDGAHTVISIEAFELERVTDEGDSSSTTTSTTATKPSSSTQATT